MNTPDHSSSDSANLGAALEISSSAHEFPENVRAITVQSGTVYVFARRRQETDFSAQSCILELPADSILVLPDSSNSSIQFRIAGSSSTRARGLGQDATEALLASSDSASCINILCDAITNQTSETDAPEGRSTVASIGVEMELEPGPSLVATSADQPVTWLFETEGGAPITTPVTSCAAITIDGPRQLMPCDTPGAVERMSPAGMAETLSTLFLEFTDQRLQLEDLHFGQRVRRSERAARARVESTAKAVAEGITLERPPPLAANATSGFDAACRRVVTELGVTIKNKIVYQQNTARSPIEQFARAARVETREVTLETGWWKSESGHLIGWVDKNRTPVALIHRRRGYLAHVYHDTDQVEKIPVDAAFAARLSPRCITFYPSLPARALTMLDIVKMAFRGSRTDLLKTLAATISIALLNLVTPLVIALITSTVIPLADVDLAYALGIGLFLAALSTALIGIVSGLAFLRVESRSSYFLVAAFVQRILQLPAPFFRETSAGDLTQRVMAIERIRSKLTQSVIMSLTSFVSGFSYIGLMFIYDPTLALYATVLVVGMVGGLVMIGVLLARREYIESVTKGELDGTAMDMISGIRQVRLQGSSTRMIAMLLDRLGNVARQTYITQILTAILTLFTRVYPLAATLTIFAIFATQIQQGNKTLSNAEFLGFNAALGGFFASSSLIGMTFNSLVSIIPMYQRLRPLMETVPEVQENMPSPGRIEGGIKLRNITFRYAEDLPLVLDGIDISAEPGECIAIVGQTGCGKSTLLKIILGLERAEAGSVFFDGIELDSVDAGQVRSQLGVVMQASTLSQGNIRSTILGLGTSASMDVAWDAARLVQMEQEIEDMPMGMLTMTSGNSLSGGQAQRLLIARALVGNPRILLLDEATSSLDDESQAAITASIMGLGATRIIIAHRLSTILEADRIYVLEKGSVVQNGTFEELSSVPGLFRQLVENQSL
jgi:NHLM bacteriocin system ABC transporter ATP-binding protein